MNTSIYFLCLVQILLGTENVLDKSCRENQNAHFTLNNLFISYIVPFMR